MALALVTLLSLGATAAAQTELQIPRDLDDVQLLPEAISPQELLGEAMTEGRNNPVDGIDVKPGSPATEDFLGDSPGCSMTYGPTGMDQLPEDPLKYRKCFVPPITIPDEIPGMETPPATPDEATETAPDGVHEEAETQPLAAETAEEDLVSENPLEALGPEPRSENRLADAPPDVTTPDGVGPVAQGPIRHPAVPSLPGIVFLAVGAALWRLVAFLAPLFSRLGDRQAAQQSTRAILLDTIAANPGIHVGELRRTLGLADGQVRHHLRVLESFGLVMKTPSGHYVCYYVNEQAAQQWQRVAPFLKSSRAKFLLSFIQQHPGTAVADLEREAGVQRGSFNYHVERLVAANLVEIRRQGGRRFLFVAGALHSTPNEELERPGTPV
ncbi:MAG TPA: MarR family transcriptional regulator [Candidatus Thermoplasmatota archaeon]|nr:MarR family transcriptional regulator [Candidatus Thermoplasmatota archaeon]